PGELSVYDDRHTSHPWGIGGGLHGGCSRKRLIRADGSEAELQGKIDFVEVGPGDRLVYETAGAGGWGDPLERRAEEVAIDVEKGFVTAAAAERLYGVVLDGEGVDAQATARLRATRRRGRVGLFDFGPRPAGYATTLEFPEIEPLGAAQAVA